MSDTSPKQAARGVLQPRTPAQDNAMAGAAAMVIGDDPVKQQKIKKAIATLPTRLPQLSKVAKDTPPNPKAAKRPFGQVDNAEQNANNKKQKTVDNKPATDRRQTIASVRATSAKPAVSATRTSVAPTKPAHRKGAASVGSFTALVPIREKSSSSVATKGLTAGTRKAPVPQEKKAAVPTKSELEQLKESLKGKEAEIESLQKELQRSQGAEVETQLRLVKLQEEKEELERRIRVKDQVIETANKDLAKKTEELAARDQQCFTLTAELDQTKTQLQTSTALSQRQAATIQNNEQQIDGLNKRVQELVLKAVEADKIRRDLLQVILDLKGNIRVFCRVRPGAQGQRQTIKFTNDPDKKGLVVVGEAAQGVDGTVRAAKEYEMFFDRVFHPRESQADVFSEIESLVSSAMDGYAVNIFAYGQTGTGKTYTMEGPVGESKEETRGVMWRAVKHVFERMQTDAEKGWTFTLEASCCELYNEKLVDLSDAKAPEPKAPKGKGKQKDADERAFVPVTSVAEVLALLAKASSLRAVSATKSNETSSRSHGIFTLTIKGKNELLGTTTSGVLNLVDLAGSEALKKSGAEGAQKEETININLSLHHLRNVITNLAAGTKASYGDSKLTQLLKPAFTSNSSKTLMFVNVSPDGDDCKETLNSLRFAQTANTCHLGAARSVRQ